jgi:hypothetical protein
MTLVDWRWAARNGFWIKSEKRWNAAKGGFQGYLRQRKLAGPARPAAHQPSDTTNPHSSAAAAIKKPSAARPPKSHAPLSAQALSNACTHRPQRSPHLAPTCSRNARAAAASATACKRASEGPAHVQRGPPHVPATGHQSTAAPPAPHCRRLQCKQSPVPAAPPLGRNT